MRENTEMSVDELMASIGIVQVAGPAKPEHEDIALRLIMEILHKHNRHKMEVNETREEPYKLDEVKTFEMCHHKGMSTTFVTIETGLIGDEGSAASIYCRDHRHIAIAKNGGLTLLNAKRKRESLGRFHAIYSLTK